MKTIFYYLVNIINTFFPIFSNQFCKLLVRGDKGIAVTREYSQLRRFKIIPISQLSIRNITGNVIKFIPIVLGTIAIIPATILLKLNTSIGIRARERSNRHKIIACWLIT